MMDGKTIQKKLVGNEQERAVSPVIGVILMVAITVILAAVIAAFVLDMSPGGDSAPQANYDWNSNSEEVTVSHQSGDDIDMSSVEIRVEADGSSGTVQFTDSEFAVGDSITFAQEGTDDTNSTIMVDLSSSGSTPLEDSDGNVIEGTAEDISSVSLVYNDGDSGSVMSEYEP